MEQRLIQSPQMIQAMQILQLGALDLQERIEAELLENPFLELSEPEAPDRETSAADAEPETREAAGVEQMLDELERYERDFGDRGLRPNREDADRKYEAMQNTPNQPETLAQALLAQTAILTLDEREQTILEYVVFSLDDRGYLTDSLEDIAASLSREVTPPVDADEVDDALQSLRDVTHPAIGCRDLSDCLLLQLEAHGFDHPLARSVIADHLEDLEANRLPRISKATGRSIDDVKQAVAFLRTLDPIPGAEYGETRNSTIQPDVIVEEIDGDYVVRLDRERVPDLTLSPVYRKLLGQAERGDEVREWVKKKLESARWFLDAVQQRQSTLQRISEALFRRQRDFLERGIPGLHPLRMQEIADEISVHISTVSRGVAGKYAQTPRGIFPLKFFFTGGTATASGEVASQVSIKERIRQIVAQEDSSKPLSDDQIAQALEEADGVKIARRTVTKYRKALEIPSSSQRRAY